MINVMRVLLWVTLLCGCRANQQALPNWTVPADPAASTAPDVVDSGVPTTAYRQSAARSPFALPQDVVVPTTDKPAARCVVAPPASSVPVRLAGVALASLRLTGTMGKGRAIRALVATPQGRVESVSPGEWLGTAAGQVLEVSDHQLVVEEILPDGDGCWTRHPVTLTMQ